MATPDYLAVNRANWDERAPAHASSPDYRVEELVADPTALTRPCPGPGAPGCDPATCPAATALCRLSEAI